MINGGNVRYAIEEKLWGADIGRRDNGASVKTRHCCCFEISIMAMLTSRCSYLKRATEDPLPGLEIRWPIMQKESRKT